MDGSIQEWMQQLLGERVTRGLGRGAPGGVHPHHKVNAVAPLVTTLPVELSAADRARGSTYPVPSAEAPVVCVFPLWNYVTPLLAVLGKRFW